EVAMRGGMAEGGRAVAVEDRPVSRAAELALLGHGRASRTGGRRRLLHREGLGAAAHVRVGAVEEVLLRVRGVQDLEVGVDLIRDARGDGVREVLVRPITMPGPAGGTTPTASMPGAWSPTSKKKLGIA